jgi:hypothetical protein
MLNILLILFIILFCHHVFLMNKFKIFCISERLLINLELN